MMPLGPQRLLAPLIGCLGLVAMPSGAEAQSLLQALFGPPPQQRPAAYAAPPFLQPFLRPFEEPRRRARPQPDRVRAPKPDEAPKVPLSAADLKPARVMPDDELVSAFMRDQTLQKGDIVVFPDGPRVFTGKGQFASHQMGDFEDIRSSRLVNERTRKDVIAATPTLKRTEPKISFTARPRRGR